MTAKKVRKCGYCRVEGHDRRKCPELSEVKDVQSKKMWDDRKEAKKFFGDIGLGIGAILKRTSFVCRTEQDVTEEELVYYITDIKWKELLVEGNPVALVGVPLKHPAVEVMIDFPKHATINKTGDADIVIVTKVGKDEIYKAFDDAYGKSKMKV